MMYFWSTNRQDGDITKFVDDIRITLPTSWPLNTSYIFATWSACLSQPSNFGIDVNTKNKQEKIVNKQKTQPIGSIMSHKTRTNKLMVGKILEQRSCRYRMGRKLSHVMIQFFFELVTTLCSYLQKQQIKMPNPIAVECQVVIFL